MTLALLVTSTDWSRSIIAAVGTLLATFLAGFIEHSDTLTASHSAGQWQSLASDADELWRYGEREAWIADDLPAYLQRRLETERQLQIQDNHIPNDDRRIRAHDITDKNLAVCSK